MRTPNRQLAEGKERLLPTLATQATQANLKDFPLPPPPPRFKVYNNQRITNPNLFATVLLSYVSSNDLYITDFKVSPQTFVIRSCFSVCIYTHQITIIQCSFSLLSKAQAQARHLLYGLGYCGYISTDSVYVCIVPSSRI